MLLGGGGARTFAHIGVLRAMQEAGIEVDAIGGRARKFKTLFRHASHCIAGPGNPSIARRRTKIYRLRGVFCP